MRGRWQNFENKQSEKAIVGSAFWGPRKVYVSYRGSNLLEEVSMKPECALLKQGAFVNSKETQPERSHSPLG